MYFKTYLNYNFWLLWIDERQARHEILISKFTLHAAFKYPVSNNTYKANWHCFIINMLNNVFV